ncbi:hypothetical protein BH11ARM1_BH11ARM1_03630 [soil metagenome]
MKNINAFAGVAIIASGFVVTGLMMSQKAHASMVPLLPTYHQPYDSAVIDENITLHEGRVKTDPKGAIGYAMLSGAYLARSRESDSDVAAWKAEDAARQSLKLRTAQNDVAQAHLVQALLEQHRFQDALVEATKIDGIKKDSKEGPKLTADCLIEIGKFDEAKAILAKFVADPRDYGFIAINARMASGLDDHKTSLDLYQKALVQAQALVVSEQDLSWFYTKIGTEQEALGELVPARKSFEKALELYPNSYKATLGMGRINLAEKRYDDAIAFADRTLPIANSLDAKSTKYDALLAQGKKEAAAKELAEIHSQFKAEVATFDRLHKGGKYDVRPIDRQFATFCVNHKVFAAEGLVAAARDYNNRPDPLGKKNFNRLTAMAY